MMSEQQSEGGPSGSLLHPQKAWNVLAPVCCVVWTQSSSDPPQSPPQIMNPAKGLPTGTQAAPPLHSAEISEAQTDPKMTATERSREISELMIAGGEACGLVDRHRSSLAER